MNNAYNSSYSLVSLACLVSLAPKREKTEIRNSAQVFSQTGTTRIKEDKETDEESNKTGVSMERIKEGTK